MTFHYKLVFKLDGCAQAQAGVSVLSLLATLVHLVNSTSNGGRFIRTSDHCRSRGSRGQRQTSTHFTGLLASWLPFASQWLLQVSGWFLSLLDASLFFQEEPSFFSVPLPSRPSCCSLESPLRIYNSPQTSFFLSVLYFFFLSCHKHFC